MIRHSQAYILAVFLVGIIAIGLTMTLMMKPLGVVYDKTYNLSTVQDEAYQTFYTRTNTIWIWLPVLLVFPYVYWILIKSHQKNV